MEGGLSGSKGYKSTLNKETLMSKTILSLFLVACLPWAAAAKKYSPAQWTQFADVGMSDPDPTMPKIKIHVGSPAKAKKTKTKRKKSRKSTKSALGVDWPPKIVYNF
jgi:hypothetical protein